MNDDGQDRLRSGIEDSLLRDRDSQEHRAWSHRLIGLGAVVDLERLVLSKRQIYEGRKRPDLSSWSLQVTARTMIALYGWEAAYRGRAQAEDDQ